MRTKLKLLISALCSLFATIAAFGQGTGNAIQTNFTWIASGANLDLATSTNWTPTGVPNPARRGLSSDYGDILEFDGQTAGPVFASSNGGSQTGNSVGGITAGLYVHLTANQTNPVTFHTTVQNTASSGIRFNGITIDAGAGTFNFGKGSTTNALDTIWGTSNPQSQYLINNSTNPAIIYSDLRWRLGAGGAHTFVFSGTGDWYVANDFSTGGSSFLVQKDGAGTMYWTVGHNSFSLSGTPIASPLTVSGGTLVLKSGGMLYSTTTINNNGTALVYDAPPSSQAGGVQAISGSISGTGALQVNNGTLTLSGGPHTYTGITTVSGNGMLLVNSVGGDINVSGGTLVPVGIGSTGPLNVAGNLNIASGILVVSLNKALSPSNGFVAVGGTITNSGGTLKLLNFGPNLAAGDKFTIFQQAGGIGLAVNGGEFMPIVSPGFTVTNNLAMDGSVTVTTAAPPPIVTATPSDGQLNLSWPAIWTGLHVQIQTNSIATGLRTNWITIPGTDAGNSYWITPDNSKPTVFYRLAP